MPVTRSASNISASRAQVLRGEKAIGSFLKNKRPVGARASSVVQATYAVELQSLQPGLVFFFQVSKRDVPEAHDRQKLKRWLREAIRRSEPLKEVSQLAKKGRKRIQLGLRLRTKPGPEVNWQPILADVLSIGEALLVKVTPKPGLVLVKRTETAEMEADDA